MHIFKVSDLISCFTLISCLVDVAHQVEVLCFIMFRVYRNVRVFNEQVRTTWYQSEEIELWRKSSQKMRVINACQSFI
ncbi:hypothetical protein AB4K20DRAFT_1911706 [Rhizopus microsporus]